MNKVNKESFEWLKKPEELPKENLIKLIVKTTSPTLHPEDTKYPKRIFPEAELQLAARSLIGKPIGLNHKMIIEGSMTLDSEWNPIEQQVEALGYVPTQYINKVKGKEISKCSAEYSWREEKEEDNGIAFYGLNFLRVDLLEGLKPGDPNTQVVLFEAAEKKGNFLGEVQEQKVLKEPCSPELQACVDELIAKGEPEESAWAICKAQLGEAKVEEVKAVESKPEEKKEEKKEERTLIEDAAKRVKGLEEAVTRLTNTVKDLEKNQTAKIESAKKEAKEETLKKIESVVPSNIIMRQGNQGLVRLATDIKKIIREESTNEPTK